MDFHVLLRKEKFSQKNKRISYKIDKEKESSFIFIHFYVISRNNILKIKKPCKSIILNQISKISVKKKSEFYFSKRNQN